MALNEDRPLLDETESEDHSVLHYIFQKEDRSIDDVLQRSKNLTRWSVFRAERAHVETIDQLRHALKVLGDFQLEVRGGAVHHVIHELGSLEMSLCAAGGASAALMKFLALEINQHLAPCPDAKHMQDIAKALAKIGNTMCASTTPAPISAWADWNFVQADPRLDGYNGPRREKMFQEESAIFKECLLSELGSKIQCQGCEVMQYFKNLMQLSACRGRFGFMGRAEVWMSALDDPKSALLPWTTIGFLLKQWLQKGIITSQEVAGGTLKFELDIQRRFRELSAIVIPRFVAKVSELQSRLEQRLKEVDGMRTRFVAYGVTATITVGQFLVPLVGKRLGLYTFLGDGQD